MVEVDGFVTSIVYKNEDNGYTVAKINCEQDRENYSIVGYMHYLSEGQRVRLKGEWTYHKSFGKQIKVESFEEVLPTTSEGIEKYLASGLINGIGPVTAKKIMKAFGDKALDIIENTPERLTEVEGIGSKKAQRISESLKDQREVKEIMIFLQGHGITPSHGVKIYKKYGVSSIHVVRENPYRLCEDIKGIGFKTADKIAKSLGIDVNSPFRIASGIKYVLKMSTGTGHTYLPRQECIDRSAAELVVDKELVEEGITTLNLSKDIIIDEVEEVQCIYLPEMFFSEIKTAKKLVELNLNKIGLENIDVDTEIKDFEKENGISFAPEQIKAIKDGVENGVCVITGGPGTGKTTIIKCIISIFENRSYNVCLCAPTGRAAKRMSESTGYEARTIHRLLKVEYISEEEDRSSFAKDEDDTIEADVIIVDEASMIDIMLMNSLLKAMSSTTRLILVGDIDQLPSVGPGNVLRDIIESEGVVVSRLERIFRQSQESLITVNAHKINSGDMPILNAKDKDFFFLKNPTQSGIIDEISELVNVRLPKFKGDIDKTRDIQILASTRKGEAGVISLNHALQSILNPASPRKKEKKVGEYTLREGDKVMQTKNDYSLTWESLTDDAEGTGIFNGDIGYIDKINTEDGKAYIIYDEDKRVEYDFSSLDEVELAYAITIHKSQGSEFPVCVIPVTEGPIMLQTRNLIYTGVTRAKSLLVLIGSVKVLERMVKNKTITSRYSSLKNRIKNFCEVIK
ncbi:MAG: ATP-dependent RecD-like DNA helicase [Clostridium sp.]|uniref:SF1B family DNA helicase RecD2 n=1 Tax=Clostridium sp. TaxID=1506 RepID=UPI002FCC9471